MSRFTSSKYKNAVVNVFKKELWINDLQVGSNLSPNGDHIKASSDYVAFIHSMGGLAALPITAKGRFTDFPLITGHSGSVTDFCFSPFHSNVLSSGSEDGYVKLWSIPPQEELVPNYRLSKPSLTLGPLSSKIENVLFHPSSDNVLAVSSKQSVEIYDVEQESKCFDLKEHEDIVESISWHGNGHLMSTLCKSGNEKRVRIFDPRASTTCISAVDYHSGLKNSRTLFLSDTDYLVTAGFNKMREAELVLWDMKSFNKPLSRQSLGSSSTGSPSLLFDGDSKMLFVALKGENTISFFECTSSLVPGSNVYRGSQQTKGVAMIPKLAVDVMSCEIVRLLQLTQNSVVPISYHVQRKSHSDFHADLYPETPGDIPAMTAKEWLGGANDKCAKVSLDPKKQRKAVCIKREVANNGKGLSDTNGGPSSPINNKQPTESIPPPHDLMEKTDKKSMKIVRSSKFRHIDGKFKHRSSFITKFPALRSTVPGDSNSFQINRDRVAVVLSIPGGQLGVFELKKSGRLDQSDIPTLQNGSEVMDFAFDPFDTCKIVVACEDAKLRVWTLPSNGLSSTLKEPQYLVGHQDKPNILAFHPQARSLLATAGYDCRLLLWDLSKLSVSLSLEGSSEPLFSMAWSPNGTQLATFSRDHILRMYDPRSSLCPISRGSGPIGSRGARLVWLEDSVIAISCFAKSGMRTITLFSTKDMIALSEVAISISPSTLIPHFDVDTKLLFLTGKGDSEVFAYEYVKSEAPYLFKVSPFSCGSPHQAVAYLPKVLCDVAKVEIACGMRLTPNSVEGFGFHVPRTRTTYFQDDVYPDTLCLEESSLTAQEWLQGTNAPLKTCCLKPSNMKSLSEAPKEAAAAKKFTSFNPKYKSDQQKKDELMSSMIDRMGDKEDEPLPQVNMDGADSDEWSD